MHEAPIYSRCTKIRLKSQPALQRGLGINGLQNINHSKNWTAVAIHSFHSDNCLCSTSPSKSIFVCRRRSVIPLTSRSREPHRIDCEGPPFLYIHFHFRRPGTSYIGIPTQTSKRLQVFWRSGSHILSRPTYIFMFASCIVTFTSV